MVRKLFYVFCQRFLLAGVQWREQCFCGNDGDKYGAATNCNLPCAGNKQLTCGGGWANSVYKTGNWQLKPFRKQRERERERERARERHTVLSYVL